MSTLSSSTRSTLRKQLREFMQRCESSSAQRQLPVILYPAADAFPPRVPDALHINVLDSSFNPPSHAHLALSTIVPPAQTHEGKAQHSNAHLLLFSANNADKGSGRKGDVKTENRLDLMLLLAKDVEAALVKAGQEANVFVALVDKPLMGDKSTLIHALLRHQQDAGQGNGAGSRTSEHNTQARLHYIVGTDTLVRFFEPKYYGGQEGFERVCEQFFDVEGTRFLCVRRPATGDKASVEQAKKEEQQMLDRENIRGRIDSGDVVIVDVPQAEGISSTRVRRVLQGSQSSEQKREELKELVTPNIAEYLLTEKDIWID